MNDISGEPDCAFDSSKRALGSLITFVKNGGAEVWLTDPDHKTKVPPTTTTVAGFPALQITVMPDSTLADQCTIVVDVHDGQYIEVFSSSSPGGPKGSTPYCAEAKRVASMVIETAENR